MSSLDLDINNYSIKDIETFFRLDSKKKYTAADIELREVTIREQLIKSGHVDRRFVKDLIDFTQLAKDWLIFVKCPPEAKPTTIPKNARLDTFDYPRSAVPPQTREGEILQREKTPFIYTQPSAFFPGDLNPLNNRILTKYLTIDTKFRENYYNSNSSDFMIQLPTKLLKVVSMELVAIELPLSFYYISSERGNNFLWIKVSYLKCIDMYDYFPQENCPHCHQEYPPMEPCPHCHQEYPPMEPCPHCHQEYPPMEPCPHCHQEYPPMEPCPHCHSQNYSPIHNHYHPQPCVSCGEAFFDNCLRECQAKELVESEKCIIIPDGNYTVSQLINLINNILSPKDISGNPFNPKDIFAYIQFVIDTTESNQFGLGMVRIQGCENVSTSIQEISLDFSKNMDGVSDNALLSTRFGWILGFQLATYTGNFIVADAFAQNAFFQYAYFAVDDFQNNVNNSYISSFQTSIFQPNILARLSFHSKEMQSIYFSDTTNMVAEPRIYFGPVDIQRLQIRLFDEYGRIIDTNHGNYSFCIKFQFLYNL
jgi:hypothetical protein